MGSNSGKIIGSIALAPFILIALGVAYCELNKAYWDHRVKEMCEKDGGVTVYQQINITPEQAMELGVAAGFMAVGPKVKWRNEVPAYTEDAEIIIKDGILKVFKHERTVIRNDTGVVIGKIVSYGRSGGDAIPIDHPSSFRCPKIPEYYKDQEKFFYIKGDKNIIGVRVTFTENAALQQT